jgi:hypothetical protein
VNLFLGVSMTLTFFQALNALKDGVDLRGMFLWTLIDNFEWHEDFQQQFGLYACDIRSGDLDRVPRGKSVTMATAIHQLLPPTVEEVAAQVDALILKISQLQD